MIDRTTKVLLALIAFGIWLNIALPIYRPSVAVAQDFQTPAFISSIASYVQQIATGTCLNHRLCGP